MDGEITNFERVFSFLGLLFVLFVTSRVGFLPGAVVFALAALAFKFMVNLRQSGMISDYAAGSVLAANFPESFRLTQDAFMSAKKAILADQESTRYRDMSEAFMQSRQEYIKYERKTYEALLGLSFSVTREGGHSSGAVLRMNSFISEFSRVFPNWPAEKDYIVRMIEDYDCAGEFYNESEDDFDCEEETNVIADQT